MYDTDRDGFLDKQVGRHNKEGPATKEKDLAGTVGQQLEHCSKHMQHLQWCHVFRGRRLSVFA